MDLECAFHHCAQIAGRYFARQRLVPLMQAPAPRAPFKKYARAPAA